MKMSQTAFLSLLFLALVPLKAQSQNLEANADLQKSIQDAQELEKTKAILDYETRPCVRSVVDQRLRSQGLNPKDLQIIAAGLRLSDGFSSMWRTYTFANAKVICDVEADTMLMEEKVKESRITCASR